MGQQGQELMKSSPQLVSIVLTTLNAAGFLREAVDSCLNQNYREIELIAVDGGSTDDTLAILQSYVDPRLRIVHQRDNDGKLPGAINLGLAIAVGKYLTWMQADSSYDEDAIAVMVKELESHPEIGQVYADYRVIEESGTLREVVQTREPEEFLPNLGDPAGVCFLIRREVREVVGPHDVNAFPSQDYDYRMRIALHCPSRRIPRPLYSWRVHDGSLTSQFGWANLARKDIEIRQKMGLDTPPQTRKRSAEIDIAEAFERYQSNQKEGVPWLVVSGLWRDPAYAANRGVWSILIRSLLE